MLIGGSWIGCERPGVCDIDTVIRIIQLLSCTRECLVTKVLPSFLSLFPWHHDRPHHHRSNIFVFQLAKNAQHVILTVSPNRLIVHGHRLYNLFNGFYIRRIPSAEISYSRSLGSLFYDFGLEYRMLAGNFESERLNIVQVQAPVLVIAIRGSIEHNVKFWRDHCFS